MAESLFLRVRRLISAGVGDAFDALERANGAGVMREAIREVDRAIDEVRAEQDAATTRRLQAMRQQRLFRGQLAAMDEKARFAIAADRDDLAEAALSRRFDFEEQAERLETVRTDAASEVDRLEECLTALTTRKTQMEEALTSFETAQRKAVQGSGAVQGGGDGPARPARRTEHKVKRAEEAFDRAMAAAGGIAGISRADTRTAAKVAEIDTLRKAAAISERMASLRPAREGSGQGQD